MKVDMVMPKMGESITEGTILKWLKKEGQKVERDEIILEISTDKVDSEIPAPYAGVLKKILVPEGETVEVGSVIAEIDTEAQATNGTGEATTGAPPAGAKAADKEPAPQPAKAPAPQAPPPAAEPATKAAAVSAPAGPSPAPAKASGRFYSPLVRSIAAAEGVSAQELETIPGTGQGGRVKKEDLLAYLKKRGAPVQAAPPVGMPAAAPVSRPAPAVAMPQMAAAAGAPATAARVEIMEMDNMRQSIAEHMIRSVQTSAHVYSLAEADLTHLVKYREAVKETFLQQEGFKLTYQPFFMYAAARALRDYPLVNSSLDGKKIVLKKDIHIGMAVALPQGLIVPVVKNADTLTLLGMARACNDLAQRARGRKLLPDEVQGGTFTITNLGSFNTLIGTPIISQPQVAILGVGVIKKRVMVVNEAIAIRDMVYLSLGFDHRIIDGALGGLFLDRVVQYLEKMEPENI